MNDLKYITDQIIRHCEDAENTLLKEGMEKNLQDLIKAKLEVIEVLKRKLK